MWILSIKGKGQKARKSDNQPAEESNVIGESVVEETICTKTHVLGQ